MSNTLSHAHNNFLCYKYDWHIQKFNDESRDPTIHGVIPKKTIEECLSTSTILYSNIFTLYLPYFESTSREDIYLWYAMYNIAYKDNKPR